MEKLRIYQEALQLTKEIYLLTNIAVLKRDYSLCDQIRRASISIVSNIAEGYMRSGKHCKNFYGIASGSANEVVAQLQIISVVYTLDTFELQQKFKILGKKINAFCKTF
jgi:four helix bundle protein